MISDTCFAGGGIALIASALNMMKGRMHANSCDFFDPRLIHEIMGVVWLHLLE